VNVLRTLAGYAGGMKTPESNLDYLVERPVFIVRFWWESGDPSGQTPGEWRGSVELASSGEPRYFRTLTGLDEIIAAQLAALQQSQEGNPITG
jgi:hypothetical protein